MKKIFCTVLTVLMIFMNFQNFVIAENNGGYSKYEGKWMWENTIPYIEINSKDNWYQWDEAYVEVLNINGNNIEFEFYHQKGGVHLLWYDICRGTIEGNTVVCYTNAHKGGPALAQFRITLTLNDNTIRIETYNVSEGGVAFEGICYRQSDVNTYLHYNAVIKYMNGVDSESVYSLYDLDQDGVLELIIDDNKSHTIRNVDFYKYDNELKFLGLYQPGYGVMCKNPEGKGIVMYYALKNYQWLELLSYNQNCFETQNITESEYVNAASEYKEPHEIIMGAYQLDACSTANNGSLKKAYGIIKTENIDLEYLTKYYWYYDCGDYTKYKFNKDGTYVTFDSYGNIYEEGQRYSLKNNTLTFHYEWGDSSWIYVDKSYDEALSYHSEGEKVFFAPETGYENIANTYEEAHTEDNPSQWALEEVNEAINLGLVPAEFQRNYQHSISREVFCDLVTTFIVAKSNLSLKIILEKNNIESEDVLPIYSDTNSKSVRALAGLDIISGYGNNIFGAEDSLTREQAATILYKVTKFMTNQIPDNVINFNDSDRISDWAEEGVNFISSCIDSNNNYRVMGDAGNRNFDPQGTYTVEQSIISLKRLFNYINFVITEYGIVVESDSAWNNSSEMIHTLLLQNSAEENMIIDVDNIKWIIQMDEATNVNEVVNNTNKMFEHISQNATWRDITYFSFNGHGNTDGIGTHSAYYYKYKELYNILNKLNGTVVIWIDACESGVIIDQYNWNRRFKILTAAYAGNYTNVNTKGDLLFSTGELIAWESSKYSQFSYNLGKGLGWFDDECLADLNKDKKVSLKELFEYIDSDHGWNLGGESGLEFKESTTPQVFPENDNSVIFAW